jgi:cysteinyl-tRNA synthetase
MQIQLYNTLTRKKEIFKPIKKGSVTLYTCGPTVYNYAHIGNLRTFLFEDILRRTFLYNKYKVKQVMNITDVGHLTSDSDTGEDKLEVGAKREKKTAWEVAEFYTKAFMKDLEKLNILPAHKFPKATDHIKEMTTMIDTLEKKGFTYETDDGIYFDTSKLKDYGKLDPKNIAGIKAGKRIDIKGKKNPTDFALWKFSPRSEKRQMEWKFKGKMGFPGWHIECSAMSMKYLGNVMDIHCGGMDHVQVHHTNEIAQSEATTGKPFVNYWLHSVFLVMKDAKMSKSKGNILTLDSLEKLKFSALDYRYFLLTAHYRTPLTFSYEALEGAQNAYNNLKEKLQDLKHNPTKKQNKEIIKEYKRFFLEALNDDLDTPKALALAWRILKETKLGNKEKYDLILDFDKVLGLNLKENTSKKMDSQVKKLIEDREKARKSKAYKKADEIRKEIEGLGIILEDTSEGVRWKFK